MVNYIIFQIKIEEITFTNQQQYNSMAQPVCNATYKRKGKENFTICNRVAKFKTSNGTPCCGYHNKGHFLLTPKQDTFVPFECSICCEMCDKKDVQYVTKCNHSFHKNCMKKWAAMKCKLTCPLCRTKIKDHPFICKTKFVNTTDVLDVQSIFDRNVRRYNLVADDQRAIITRLQQLFVPGQDYQTRINSMSEYLNSVPDDQLYAPMNLCLCRIMREFGNIRY